MITKLKIQYETDDTEKVNEAFEKEITELANKLELNFFGSGFNNKDQVRDIKFHKPTPLGDNLNPPDSGE